MAGGAGGVIALAGVHPKFCQKIYDDFIAGNMEGAKGKRLKYKWNLLCSPNSAINKKVPRVQITAALLVAFLPRYLARNKEHSP